MSSTQPSDPLLNQFAVFYQILGLRVTPCTLRNWKNSLWSALLTCPLLYSFLFNSPFTFAVVAFTKPLLNWLQAFNDALFAVSSLGLFLYYQINGPMLLRHLKSFPRRRAASGGEPKECKAGKLSFVWFLCLSQGLFGLGYVPFFTRIFDRTLSIRPLIYILSLYINYHYLLLTPFLLHYAHHTITVALRELVEQSERLPAVEIVAQVQRISKWTKELNRLLTLPLVLWALNYSIDTLVNIAFLGAIIRTYLMVFFTALAIYFLYIVHFQGSIQLLLRKLSKVGVATVR